MLTPTALLLAWLLFALLFAWMVTFLVLALRSGMKNSVEHEERMISPAQNPAGFAVKKQQVRTAHPAPISTTQAIPAPALSQESSQNVD
ncbi:MAG: hypothetical protein IMW89_10515 [Ktedonobacteraceae bacterium]|nr:hypothetical protein [Ktedonobacteraceae bacterium]